MKSTLTQCLVRSVRGGGSAGDGRLNDRRTRGGCLARMGYFVFFSTEIVHPGVLFIFFALSTGWMLRG